MVQNHGQRFVLATGSPGSEEAGAAHRLPILVSSVGGD